MKHHTKIPIYLIFIAAVAFVVIVILITKIAASIFIYDPDRHVCIEYGNKYTPEQCDDGVLYIGRFDFCSVNDTLDLQCTNWRKKEYCDRRPMDTDKCVCEQYDFERRIFPDPEMVKHIVFEDNCKVPGVSLVYCSDNVSFCWGTMYGYRCKVETCTKAHKKTIADLNCTELKDYFENGRQCEGVPPWRVCKYPPIDDKVDILYQIVVKC